MVSEQQYFEQFVGDVDILDIGEIMERFIAALEAVAERLATE